MALQLLPSVWRHIPERYSLLGSHCETCGKDYFPQRLVCATCRRKGKIVQKLMPREGKIASYTLVHAAPAGFELEAPYFLAIIELPNGVRLLTQVVDSDASTIAIGAPARMVFRKISEDGKQGAIAYGYKFKVVKPVHSARPASAGKPVGKQPPSSKK